MVVRPTSSSTMEKKHTFFQLCFGNTCSWKHSCGKQLLLSSFKSPFWLAVVCEDVTEHRKRWLGSFVITRGKKLSDELSQFQHSHSRQVNSGVEKLSFSIARVYPNQSSDKPRVVPGADEVELKRIPRKLTDLHRKQDKKLLLVLSKYPDSKYPAVAASHLFLLKGRHCRSTHSSLSFCSLPWPKISQHCLILSSVYSSLLPDTSVDLFLPACPCHLPSPSWCTL